jgi:small subunit ribosomal protein S1
VFEGKVEVQEGDTVEVTVDAIEDGFGETKLSREKAKKARAWVSLTEAFENKQILEGRITGKVKGGFIATVENLPCFMPSSQIDVRPLKKN